mgnify:CR=1 FL=1
MAIQNWSEDITVVELSDDPQFTDELGSLMETLTEKPADVVLNFSAVSFINSSNVALLLRLRKIMMATQRRMILCDVNTQAWGVLLVTDLDKIFEFTNDRMTSLATLQIANGEGEE